DIGSGGGLGRDAQLADVAFDRLVRLLEGADLGARAPGLAGLGLGRLAADVPKREPEGGVTVLLARAFLEHDARSGLDDRDRTGVPRAVKDRGQADFLTQNPRHLRPSCSADMPRKDSGPFAKARTLAEVPAESNEAPKIFGV